MNLTTNMINSETRHRAIVHYKYFTRSLRKVSKLYGVSKSSLQRWVNRDPAAYRVRKKRSRQSMYSHVKSIIHDALQADPFLSMARLAHVVKQKCGLVTSRTCISRYTSQCGFTRKKAFRTVKVTHKREDLNKFCSQHVGSQNIVCIDECGFVVGDRPRHGYSQRGKRLNVQASRTLRRTKFTLIMAISKDGVLLHRILDHNCKKADFVTFIQDLPLQPNTDVLMDNINFHHSVETVEALRKKQCAGLYLPTYSPRYNAIENVFGVIKEEYRRRCHTLVNESASTCRDAMEGIIQTFYRHDLTPYFDHAVRYSSQMLDEIRDDDHT